MPDLISMISCSVGVRVLKELYGLSVKSEEFVPFVGTGEANFLGGVARKHGAPFDTEKAKQRFFEMYLEEASKPSCRIGYPGRHSLSFLLRQPSFAERLCC